MTKQYYFLRLLPPRRSFMQDMTEDERSIMIRHAGYWSEHLESGSVVAFGPVMEPSAPHGVAILEVESAEIADQLLREDPAILADAGFRSEIFAMPRAIVRARRRD